MEGGPPFGTGEDPKESREQGAPFTQVIMEQGDTNNTIDGSADIQERSNSSQLGTGGDVKETSAGAGPDQTRGSTVGSTFQEMSQEISLLPEPSQHDTDSIVAVASTERFLEVTEGISAETKDIVRTLLRQIEELRAKSEAERRDFDLKIEECEKMYQDAAKENQKLLQQNQLLNQRDQDSKLKADSLVNNISRVRKELDQQKLASDGITKEKGDLLSTNSKQALEIEKLQGELKNYSEKTIQLNTKVCELQTNIAEVRTEKYNIQGEKERLKAQLEMVKSNAKWAEEQLAAKTASERSLRRESNDKIQSLQTEVDTRKDENEMLRNQLTVSRKHKNKLAGELESSTEQRRKMEAEHASAVRDLEAGLATKSELAKSFEESLARERKKVLVHEKTIRSMEEKSKSESKMFSVRETQLKRANRSLDEKVKTAEREIARLKQSETQLKSRLELQGGRLSATQKEIKLIELHTQSQELKIENIRLKKYLKTIQRDMQRRDPLLQQQKSQFDRMAQANKELSAKLHDVITENDREKAYALRLKEQNQKLAKERTDLNAKLNDLFQQNTLLLDKQEAARPSGVIGRKTHTDVVTKELVTFNSVEQLYSQYIRTMAVVRLLQKRCEKMEREKTTVESSRMKDMHTLIYELKNQVKTYQTQIKAKDQQGEHLMSKLEALTNGNNARFSSRDQKAITNAAPSTTVTIAAASTSAANVMMSKEFTDLKTKYDRYVTEKNLVEVQLNSSIDSLKKDNSHLRHSLTRAELDAKYSSERYDKLNGEVDRIRKELDELRKRNSGLSASLMQHQERIQHLKGTIREEKDRMMEQGASYRKVEAEVKLLRKSEARLIEENARLVGEKHKSAALMDTLAEMRASLRKTAEASHRGVIKEKQEAIAELEKHKARHERERVEMDSKLRNKSLEVEALRRRVEAHLAEAASSKSKFYEADKARLKAEHEIEKLRADLPKLREELKKSQQEVHDERELRKSMLSGDPEAKRRHQLEEDLKQANDEIKLINTALTDSKANTEKFKQMASKADALLQDYTKDRDEERSTAARLLEESKGQNSALAKRVEELTAHCRNSDREVENLKDKLSELEKKTKQEMGEALSARDSAQAMLKTVEDNMNKFKAESIQFKKMAQESHEGYERELVMHVEQNKRLNETKAQLELMCVEKEKAEAVAKEWEAKLVESKEEVKKAEAAMEAERHGFEAKLEASRRENELLESQMEVINREIQSLQQQQQQQQQQLSSGLPEASIATPSTSPNLITGAESSKKTILELRELLSLARMSKDQVSLKLKSEIQKAAMFERKYENQLKALEEAREELKNRASSQTNVYNAEEHAKQLELVMSERLLKESNMMLRTDAEKYKKRLESFESKWKRLEGEVEPLRKDNMHCKGQIDVLRSEKKSLLQDVEFWKERNRQLLDKYQMVDKQVHENLKQEHERFKAEAKLQAERASQELADKDDETKKAEKEKDDLAAKVTEVQAVLAKEKETSESLRKAAHGWKNRSKKFESKFKEAKVSVEKLKKSDKATDAVTTSNRKLLRCLASARKSFTEMQSNSKRAEQELKEKLKTETAKVKTYLTKLKTTNFLLKGEKKKHEDTKKALQAKLKTAEANVKIAHDQASMYRKKLYPELKRNQQQQQQQQQQQANSAAVPSAAAITTTTTKKTPSAAAAAVGVGAAKRKKMMIPEASSSSTPTASAGSSASASTANKRKRMRASPGTGTATAATAATTTTTTVVGDGKSGGSGGQEQKSATRRKRSLIIDRTPTIPAAAPVSSPLLTTASSSSPPTTITTPSATNTTATIAAIRPNLKKRDRPVDMGAASSLSMAKRKAVAPPEKSSPLVSASSLSSSSMEVVDSKTTAATTTAAAEEDARRKLELLVRKKKEAEEARKNEEAQRAAEAAEAAAARKKREEKAAAEEERKKKAAEAAKREIEVKKKLLAARQAALKKKAAAAAAAAKKAAEEAAAKKAKLLAAQQAALKKKEAAAAAAAAKKAAEEAAAKKAAEEAAAAERVAEEPAAAEVEEEETKSPAAAAPLQDQSAAEAASSSAMMEEEEVKEEATMDAAAAMVEDDDEGGREDPDEAKEEEPPAGAAAAAETTVVDTTQTAEEEDGVVVAAAVDADDADEMEDDEEGGGGGRVENEEDQDVSQAQQRQQPEDEEEEEEAAEAAAQDVGHKSGNNNNNSNTEEKEQKEEEEEEEEEKGEMLVEDAMEEVVPATENDHNNKMEDGVDDSAAAAAAEEDGDQDLDQVENEAAAEEMGGGEVIEDEAAISTTTTTVALNINEEEGKQQPADDIADAATDIQEDDEEEEEEGEGAGGEQQDQVVGEREEEESLEDDVKAVTAAVADAKEQEDHQEEEQDDDAAEEIQVVGEGEGGEGTTDQQKQETTATIAATTTEGTADDSGETEEVAAPAALTTDHAAPTEDDNTANDVAA